MIPKWLHTIVHDPTYLSEWAAIDQARHLAWHLGCSLPKFLTQQCEKTETCKAKSTSKHVNFADYVDVHLYSEVSPFSIVSQTSHRNVHATILSDTANFDSFVMHPKGIPDTHIPQFWTTREAPAVNRSTTAAHRTYFCSFDRDGTDQSPAMIARVQSAHLNLMHSLDQPGTEHEVAQVPLAGYQGSSTHEAMTLHSPMMQKPAQTDVAQPPIQQYRLEHQSPLDEQAASDDQSDDEQDTPGEDDNNQQPYQPAFASRLEALLRARNLHPDDGDFDLPVRTWYINHNSVHRWTSPRLLQLVGQPHTWEAQITSLWMDQIDDQDWYDVVVVQPDPPRIPRHHFVVLDLIVTQSLESTRQPGLITVLPTRPEIGDMYAVAGSFPDTISGQDVIQIADAGAFCRYRICTITHRWQQIPLTLTPAHIVGPGDGYQIVIHVPRLARPPGDLDVYGDQSRDRPIEQATKRSRSEPASSSTGPGLSTGSTVRDTPMLHIFQLEGQEVLVPLEVSQQLLPTHELANLLQVPFDCLESFHFMPIPPDGLPEQDVAAIVQRTGDVQLRTTDRLILIDIMYHHHETRVYIQPTVVREVKRVGYQIIRPHLLMTAALFHYCQALTDHCEVFLDGVIWPESDHSPRPVEHGSYALIEVSPPAGYQVDTRLAVRTLQADGETDAFMQEFRELHQQDDSMQLTQITAKVHRRIPVRISPHSHSNALAVAGQLGAVLQSITDLNPQPLGNSVGENCIDPSRITWWSVFR